MEVKFTHMNYFYYRLNIFLSTECSPHCMNGGRCVYKNTCQCPPHWTGEHCEQSLSSTTHANTHTDSSLSVSNISTSPVTCLNEGICCSNSNCMCASEHCIESCQRMKGLMK